MKLDEGWNQIHFNLTDFTRRAYGTNYLETLRVQIHANCRIRRIYFTDQLLSSKSIPDEYRAFSNANDDSAEEQYQNQMANDPNAQMMQGEGEEQYQQEYHEENQEERHVEQNEEHVEQNEEHVEQNEEQKVEQQQEENAQENVQENQEQPQQENNQNEEARPPEQNENQGEENAEERPAEQ